MAVSAVVHPRKRVLERAEAKGVRANMRRKDSHGEAIQMMLRHPFGKANMAGHAMKLTTRYDGMVVATFPDLPGVSALGVDDEDAREEGLRALEAALAESKAAPRPVPEPA